MEVPVIVAGSPITAIVDTAAQVTIMSVELSRELGSGIGSCDPIRLVTADGVSDGTVGFPELLLGNICRANN